MTGLPQGVDSEDSEQFFRKVLGVSDGSSLGGMKHILEGSKGELNRSALPQRALLSGLCKGIITFFCKFKSCTCKVHLKFELFFKHRKSLAGSLPSAGMMDAFPGLSQSPFFEIR